MGSLVEWNCSIDGNLENWGVEGEREMWKIGCPLQGIGTNRYTS